MSSRSPFTDITDASHLWFFLRLNGYKLRAFQFKTNQELLALFTLKAIL